MNNQTRHPLAGFVRQTFGEQFGAVLLTGYSEEGDFHESSLHLKEPAGGAAEAEWQLVIIGNVPKGEEPLVLAALLKLLLSCSPLTPTLEFDHEVVLSELGWPDTPSRRTLIDGAIKKYYGLTYMKMEQHSGTLRGMYSLIISYDQASEIRREDGGETYETRVYNSVTFHPQFIERLNDSRITFAGLELGEVDLMGFRIKLVQRAT